jgi:hypothetical protein
MTPGAKKFWLSNLRLRKAVKAPITLKLNGYTKVFSSRVELQQDRFWLMFV